MRTDYTNYGGEGCMCEDCPYYIPDDVYGCKNYDQPICLEPNPEEWQAAIAKATGQEG